MAESKNTKKSSAKKTSTASNTKKTNTAASTKTTAKKTTTAKKSTTTKKTTVAATKKVEKPVTVEKEVKVVEEVKQPIAKEVKENKTPIMEVLKENATLIFLCLICLLLIINIVLIVRGHKVELSNGEQVIASIDGKEVTAEELFESIKETYGTNELINTIDNFIVGKEISDTTDADKQAKEQVESIKAQYESMGYKWSDVLKDYGYDSEQVLIDEIRDSILKEEVAVNHMKANLTDADIEKYYNENIDDSYTAKHILIVPDTTDDMTDEQIAAAEAAAKATAEEVITKLNNGEAWASLVTTYSEDEGSKDTEGLIENFTKGDVVDEFLSATKELADGAYSTTPVKSQYGYHIILRVSKTEKEALETMKDELMDEIVNSKLSTEENAYTNAWAEIRNKYNFTINDTTISKYYNDAIKGE